MSQEPVLVWSLSPSSLVVFGVVLGMLALAVALRRKGGSAAPTLRPGGLLHHADRSAQMRSQASAPAKHAAGVVRVALTGGPCAGKSSALQHIVEAGKREGYDVYTAPETVTLIVNAGFSFPEEAEGTLTFQTALARLQLQMENSLSSIAAATGRPSILIFDRGVMDGKGYIAPEQWKRLLVDIGGEEAVAKGPECIEQALMKRYDAVLHLVTAADGAESFYKWGHTKDDTGNRVLRIEPPEEARAMDVRMQEAWKGHPRHIIVRNNPSEGFNRKLEAVCRAVSAVAKVVTQTP